MLESTSYLKAQLFNMIQRSYLVNNHRRRNDSVSQGSYELELMESACAKDEVGRYRTQSANLQLMAVPNKAHTENIHEIVPIQDLITICNRFRRELASESDVVELMQALQREAGGVVQAIWNLSMGGWYLQESVMDPLRRVVTDLKTGEIPLASLQELFLGCEDFIKRSGRSYERCGPGTYNYTVQLVQNFAARQWALHAKALQGMNRSDSGVLHLYQGPSKYHSAQARCLQELEDLEITPQADFIDELFMIHDAVRGSLGILSNQVVTLQDFGATLGERGWRAVRTLVHNQMIDRFPSPLTGFEPNMQTFMLMQYSPNLPRDIAKIINDTSEESTPSWNKLIIAIEDGLMAVSGLAEAQSPIEVEGALETLMKAAVDLAGIRPVDGV